VTLLEPKKPLLKSCLDSQFASSPSLLVYQEKTDDLAHNWSIKNKVTSTLQAKSLANLRAVIDYLLDSRPDTLIAVYSDHGQAAEMWDDEWVNHGYPAGKNNGFLMLINEQLRHKIKQTAPNRESAASLFLQMTLLLKNANLPKYQKDTPHTWFPAEDFERLKTLRAREMQMAQVLGAVAFEASPFLGLDPNAGLKQNLQEIGRDRTSSLAGRYESFLQGLESQFESRVSIVRSPNSKLQVCFSCVVFFLDLLLVYHMAASYAKREKMFRSPFVVLSLWFALLMVLNPLSSYSFPLVSSVFLIFIVAATFVTDKWWVLHRLVSWAGLVAADQEGRQEIASLRSTMAAFASLPLIVGSGFLLAYQLNAFRFVVYYLSVPWEVAGICCANLSLLLLILCLLTDWTAASRLSQLRLNFPNVRLHRIALVLSTATLTYMAVLTIRYEVAIFKKSSLHHDHSQMLLV